MSPEPEKREAVCPPSPHSTDGKGFLIWEVKYQIPEGTDLAVSATAIGLYPATQSQVPVDMATASSGMIVCDVIPNPAPCALYT
jgi:shikimate 5-dehydrogenase